MDRSRIAYLLQQYLDKKVTELELHELTELLLEEEEPEAFKKALDGIIAGTTPQTDYRPGEWELLYQKIMQSGVQSQESLVGSRESGRVVLMWKRYGWVAAAVVVFLVLGLWFMVGRNRSEKPSVAVTPKVQQDVAPGREGAILTLADGRQIVLDSATNGSLAQQGAADVSKQGNQLVYDQGGKAAEVVYNTMSTPKGRQYSLVLSDGSKVWLNAASSIRFPTAFTGESRVVEITGEAYFEIAHNPAKPFHVKKGETEITVLGTHFNVNAYDDEGVLRVTLLEGSVEVSSRKSGVRSQDLPSSSLAQKVRIKPGEQAVVGISKDGGASITIDHTPDVEEAMAWKNGRFSFNRADIKTVMRQLARWYDLEVSYEGEPTNDLFGGDIQRDLPLSKVLNFLEKSQVHFKVKGKKVLVQP